MAQIHIPGLRSFLMIFGIYGRLGEDIHRTDTCLVLSLKTKKSNVVQIRNFTPWSVQPEKMQIIRRIGCAMFVHVSFCGQSWKQNFPNFGLCKATNTKIWPKQNIQYLKFLMKHQALGLTKWTLGTTLPSTGHPARHRNPSKKNKKRTCWKGFDPGSISLHNGVIPLTFGPWFKF